MKIKKLNQIWKKWKISKIKKKMSSKNYAKNLRKIQNPLFKKKTILPPTLTLAEEMEMIQVRMKMAFHLKRSLKTQICRFETCRLISKRKALKMSRITR